MMVMKSTETSSCVAVNE